MALKIEFKWRTAESRNSMFIKTISYKLQLNLLRLVYNYFVLLILNYALILQLQQFHRG